MIRELKIEAVSYKTRRVLTSDQWFDAGKNLDLNDLRVGTAYQLELLQRFDGIWYLAGIVKNT